MNVAVTEDLRIRSIREVSPPSVLHEEFPLSAEAAACVSATRADIHNILAGEDDRFGHCWSLFDHDVAAAREYAERLAKSKAQHAQDLLVVMRVYFEAADDRRLEGTHQRSESRRELRNQRRPASGPQTVG